VRCAENRAEQAKRRPRPQRPQRPLTVSSCRRGNSTGVATVRGRSRAICGPISVRPRRSRNSVRDGIFAAIVRFGVSGGFVGLSADATGRQWLHVPRDLPRCRPDPALCGPPSSRGAAFAVASARRLALPYDLASDCKYCAGTCRKFRTAITWYGKLKLARRRG
jgi:hypothetical protein